MLGHFQPKVTSGKMKVHNDQMSPKRRKHRRCRNDRGQAIETDIAQKYSTIGKFVQVLKTRWLMQVPELPNSCSHDILTPMPLGNTLIMIVLDKSTHTERHINRKEERHFANCLRLCVPAGITVSVDMLPNRSLLQNTCSSLNSGELENQ